jgi:hypothetical protein
MLASPLKKQLVACGHGLGHAWPTRRAVGLTQK